ncbi:sigma-54-dependent transcriptional regulator [Anaerovorax sp. IOR16]|uniref:sigma-54-dependent transcriptional regulator n=1 Tax=Anaerovorax sp. IOR16 TaxID=2773458 RepID=UPI001FD6BB68|nr:sigma-54 dependent transcriptional regulator [Anaerovorax sp. IOR16]
MMQKNNFKILIVDDDADYRETYRMLLCSKGYEIVTAGSAKEALDILEDEYFPLVITDILMPGIDGIEFLKQIKSIYNNSIEVIMVTGYGSIETAVQTMKMGAFGYFIKSHDPEEMVLEIKKAEKMMELANIKNQNEMQNSNDVLFGSKNKEMRELWELVQQVAASKASILIMGESGVGKEIVAQRLHQISGRGKRPFIPLNCQHYPENLIESELFGHEKGAFTGALTKRVGKLEETNGGTIFLDEIGDMDLGTQVKLLRVLETKQIERIGSNKLINVDFRLISATNKNVYEKVKEGTFREDFLYRINTIEIHIPPLRKRREDLEDFISFFLQRFSKETGKSILEIEPQTKEFLLNYDYPGNVRELKNIIERLVILSNDGVLRMNQTEPMEFFEEIDNSAVVKEELLSYKEAKQEFEKRYIKEALLACGNNITKTAERMGMSRRQLFNKIVEYKIDTGEK